MLSATLLLLFGSVFGMTLIVFDTMTKALRKYEEKYVVQSVGDLSNMFLFVDSRTVFVLNLCLMGVFAVGGALVAGVGAALMGGLVGFFLPLLLVRFYRKRRIEKFNKQLVEVLQQMSGALKAGLTFQQAMEQVAKESAPPLSQEFSLTIREMKLGLPLDETLVNMAKRVGSEDLDLTVTSTNIAKQLGGNMAEMFETISGTIRERMRLEGKIKAVTSQGKMQGAIVAMMPLALGIILNFMRPDLMQPMLHHPFGWAVVASCIIGITVGWMMIMRIVNIDV
ncbi:MAG TPA: type II secretion system F family protein [Myxococcales bacterium]|jgi:tight adherence protein B|nr:type II secretion system F family protein [Myxococcales bacterium]